MKTIIATTLLLLSTAAVAVPTDFPEKVPVLDNVSYAELRLGCPAGVCNAEYLRDAMNDARKLSRAELQAYSEGLPSWKGEWDYPRDVVENYNDALVDETHKKLGNQIEVASDLVGNEYEVTITSRVPRILVKWGTTVVRGDCTGSRYGWMVRKDTTTPMYPLGEGDSIVYTTTCTSIESIKVVTNLGTAIYK